MRIERSSVYVVSGIATLPSEATLVVEDIWLELPAFGIAAAGQTARVRAWLTMDVDEAVLATDRRVAIANLILNGAGIAGVEDSALLEAEIDRVRSRRSARHSSGPFLVFQVSKAIPPQPRDPAMAVVIAPAFDLIVEGPRLAAFIDFQKQVEEVELRVLGALKLMINTHVEHHRLAADCYLVVDDRIEYRMWFDAGSAEVRVALNLTSDAALAMAAQVTSVLCDPEGSAVLGLVGHAGVEGVDQTVEFLVCFTALEQYVKRTVHSGKLGARFKALATERASSADALADIDEFDALYRVRNNLSHEGHLPSDRSYANRTRALLARYMAKPAP